MKGAAVKANHLLSGAWEPRSRRKLAESAGHRARLPSRPPRAAFSGGAGGRAVGSFSPDEE